MEDILDEALRDIKEEKMQRLFFKYTKIFVAVALISIISAISYYGWKKFQENKIYALGGEYLVGMLRLKSGESQKGLDVMERLAAGNISYSALAGLNYASFLSAKQEFTKAGQVYKMVAENKNFDPVFRDFAALMEISMRLNSKEIDASKGIEELDNYIKSKPIFIASANEQKAVLYLSLNNKEKAAEILSEIIANTNTSSNIKRRAKEMMVLASE